MVVDGLKCDGGMIHESTMGDTAHVCIPFFGVVNDWMLFSLLSNMLHPGVR